MPRGILHKNLMLREKKVSSSGRLIELKLELGKGSEIESNKLPYQKLFRSFAEGKRRLLIHKVRSFLT